MERQNTSKLFLLPALALGLIVAWASYAGTETSIENMSSSMGGSQDWTKVGDCRCEGNNRANCDGPDAYCNNKAWIVRSTTETIAEWEYESSTPNHENDWCYAMCSSDECYQDDWKLHYCKESKPNLPTNDP